MSRISSLSSLPSLTPGSETLSCEKRVYQVTAKDLPLCCPTPGMRLWDGHPRIYLPIAKTGHCVCPYCETEYILEDAKLSSD